MTAKQLAERIGQKAMWTLPAGSGVTVPVEIVDAREMFGRLEYRLTPVGGSGQVWATAPTVAIEGEGGKKS